MRRSLVPVAILLWLIPQSAQAFFSEIWGYLKQYELGIDYETSYDQVDASYLTPHTGAPDASCVSVTGDATHERCTVAMTGGNASGFGFFLQQAFKRQGLFYFRPDIGFGARYLSGQMDQTTAAKQASEGLPLSEMQFAMAALVVKPYVQFGITPDHWPDFLISAGPAVQIGLGRVSVNSQSQDVAVATASQSFIDGFLEEEIVFYRFGKGALSIYHSNDVSGNGEGTKFYPKTIDGMTDVRAEFDRTISGGFFGFGIKLLLDWPTK